MLGNSTAKRNTLRRMFSALRNDRADGSPAIIMAAVVVSIIIIVPTVGFLSNMLAVTGRTEVNAERTRALSSIATTEFDTKPWGSVMETYFSREVKTIESSYKFPFTTSYAVDALGNTGGYTIKLTAPRAGGFDSSCRDPRNVDSEKCLYYTYTKTPTLSEGVAPSWSGINYSMSDIQPVKGTESPKVDVTGRGTINLGTFDGCSTDTPDRLRVSFKWKPNPGSIPLESLNHYVIGGELFETTLLQNSAPAADGSSWFTAIINKPQPSMCYVAESISIVNGGASGVISDYFVSQLHSRNEDLHNGGTDSPEDGLPRIVTNPKWAFTSSNQWFLTFDAPLQGEKAVSYTIRGTGGGASCQTAPQTIGANNSANALYTIYSIGQFPNVNAMKTAACAMYYISTNAANGKASPEISFITSAINVTINIGANTGTPQPQSVTGVILASKDSGESYLKFDTPQSGAPITKFLVQASGTRPSCAVGTQTINAVPIGGNMYAVGNYASLADFKANGCEGYKITSVSDNNVPGNTVTFLSADVTETAKI